MFRPVLFVAILSLWGISAERAVYGEISSFREVAQECKAVPAPDRVGCMRDVFGRRFCSGEISRLTPELKRDLKTAFRVDDKAVRALERLLKDSSRAAVSQSAQVLRSARMESSCDKRELFFDRNYQSDPSVAGRMEPKTMRFHKNGHEMVFIPVAHLGGTTEKAPYEKLKKEVLLAPKPDVLILEVAGYPDDMSGYSPCGYSVEVLLRPFDPQGGEVEFLARLALEENIPFRTGEPNDRDIISILRRMPPGMLSKMPEPANQASRRKFGPADYAYYWIFRCAVVAVDREGLTLSSSIRHCLDAARDNPDIFENGKAVPPTEAELRAWYRDWNGRELTADRPLLAEETPVGSLGTNQIARVIDEIRNAAIRNVIYDEVGKHRNVRVIYGSGHLTQNQKVFENY